MLCEKYRECECADPEPEELATAVTASFRRPRQRLCRTGPFSREDLLLVAAYENVNHRRAQAVSQGVP